MAWSRHLLSVGLLAALLGQQHGVDVGQHATLSDGHACQQLGQLLIIAHSQLDVAGDDAGLLVVTGSIAGQLKDLSSQVLHDCSHVDWGTSSNSISIVSLAEKTVDTSDWELKSSTAGTGLCLALGLASFASSGHFDLIFGLTGQSEFQNLNDTCLLKLTNLYPSEDPLQLK